MPSNNRPAPPPDLPDGISIEFDIDEAIEFSAPMPGHAGWRFWAEYRPANGAGWLLARLEITPEPSEYRDGRPVFVRPPLPGLTTSVLRSLPMSRIPEWFASIWLEQTGRPLMGVAAPDARLSDFVRRPRPGAAGRGDIEYARLARRYLDACATTSSPNQVLAEQDGVEVNQIRDRLAEARKRGLMESAGRGRRGGRLTDKAKALLGAQHEGEQS